MLAFSDELQGLHVSQEVVFLGPSVHIIGHLVWTEVGNQYLFGPDHELDAAQPLKIFQHNKGVILRKAFLIVAKILTMGVDRSSRRGRFHISPTEELMILCLGYY